MSERTDKLFEEWEVPMPEITMTLDEAEAIDKSIKAFINKHYIPREDISETIEDLTTTTRVYDNPWNNGYFKALEDVKKKIKDKLDARVN